MADRSLREFDHRYIAYGNLIFENTMLEGVRCEIVVNDLDTSTMRATISAIPNGIADLNMFTGLNQIVDFESSDGRVHLSLRFAAMTISGESDEFLSFTIQECTEEFTYNTSDPRTTHFSFYIPEPYIYKRRNIITQHAQKGYMSGWRGRGRFEPAESQWKDEEYLLETSMGTFFFVPSFEFKKVVFGDREAVVVFDQMKVQITKEFEDSTPSTRLQQNVFSLLREVLQILSFLENEKLEWHYCKIIGRDEKGSITSAKHIYREVTGSRYRLRNANHLQHHRAQYQLLESKMVSSYANLTEADKKDIDRVIDRLLIACSSETIESQLLYLHSCLDILWKSGGGKGNCFAKKLISACENMQVNWLDLYPALTSEAVQEGADFPINVIRNEMLHEGGVPGDYDQAVDEHRNALALCERLVAKRLGVSYEGTGFGQKRI